MWMLLPWAGVVKAMLLQAAVGTAHGAHITIVLECYLVWMKKYGPYAFFQHNIAEGLSPTMSHDGFDRSHWYKN